MYAEIKSKSDEQPSRGKTTWLNSGDSPLSVEVKRDQSEHLGSPDWYIKVKAASYRLVGTGDRGGDMRGTNYEIELHLTREDLQSILEAAHSAGLIRSTVKIQGRS